MSEESERRQAPRVSVSDRVVDLVTRTLDQAALDSNTFGHSP